MKKKFKELITKLLKANSFEERHEIRIELNNLIVTLELEIDNIDNIVTERNRMINDINDFVSNPNDFDVINRMKYLDLVPSIIKD
ncbi:hypothetical protein OX284_004840 [Flavobacterium sp. SUN046]|uniref:hypothetical protein n=1 Tax=Flavobacterium sp. SUN046 TaxID=3002440 RepID=UPI002DB625F6|nr:hypothetical protein [Flavobacterium sp. SUN046]MEC4048747.1 hypothetical protein [Flavobacterium sp. SUN046]